MQSQIGGRKEAEGEGRRRRMRGTADGHAHPTTYPPHLEQSELRCIDRELGIRHSVQRSRPGLPHGAWMDGVMRAGARSSTRLRLRAREGMGRGGEGRVTRRRGDGEGDGWRYAQQQSQPVYPVRCQVRHQRDRRRPHAVLPPLRRQPLLCIAACVKSGAACALHSRANVCNTTYCNLYVAMPTLHVSWATQQVARLQLLSFITRRLAMWMLTEYQRQVYCMLHNVAESDCVCVCVCACVCVCVTV